jgi:GntR family transcriptional regulator, rspAB operon transcriptional repressor
MRKTRGRPAETKGSLAEHAYLSIRDEILRGHVPLGALLSRRTLAQRLGMSMLPVSEALQRLESDGLVETLPRVGTRVRVPSLKLIRDSYIVREALEGQAARLFAQKASPDERDELRRMAEHTDGLYAQCVPGETEPEFLFDVHVVHCRFHLRIAECTGCDLLRDLIEKNQMLTFNWLLDVLARHHRREPGIHRALVEVLCGEEPETAEAAMRQHVRKGLSTILQVVEPVRHALVSCPT